MFTKCTVAATALVVAMLAVVPQAGADPWINLFDKETLFGLNTFGDVEWSVADGNLVSGKGSGGGISSTSQYADFELTAKMKMAAGWSTGLLLRAACEGARTKTAHR